jgi:WhiB family transcriptional regulator, redox-sensing transcriptional regulator
MRTPLHFPDLDAQARSLWAVPRTDLDVLTSAPGEFHDWRDLAACVGTDPEAFFPETSNANAYARRVCFRCDVRGECLDWAIANGVWDGIWGGMGEAARLRLWQKRQAEAVPA